MANGTRSRHCYSKPAGPTFGFVLCINANGQQRAPPCAWRPYWNCYDNGVVCTGSMKIPREKSVEAIEMWEQSFFQSEFTHASGTRKHTRFSGGLLAMWRSLEGEKEFPSNYLVKLPQTLAEFVNDHDHGYRNQIQARD